MPDPLVPPVPTVPPITATPPAPPAPSGEYVSRKDFEDFTGKLMQRIEGQSAALGKVTDDLKASKGAAKPVPTLESVSEQVAEMQRKQAALDARDATLKRATAKNALLGEFVAAGVHPSDADEKAETLLTRHGTAIECDDAGHATIKEGDKKTPLSEFAKAFTQTDELKRIIQAKRNPTTGTAPITAAAATGAKVKVTKAQILQLPTSVKNSGNWEIVPG